MGMELSVLVGHTLAYRRANKTQLNELNDVMEANWMEEKLSFEVRQLIRVILLIGTYLHFMQWKILLIFIYKAAP